MNVLNRTQNLTFAFVEDELPPIPALTGDQEEKLEPKEIPPEKLKLSF